MGRFNAHCTALALSLTLLLSPLAALAAAPPLDVVVKQLLAGGRDGKDDRAVFSALKTLRPRSEVGAQIAAGLKDGDERIRRLAASAIGALRLSAERNAVAVAMGDAAPQVVVAAAQALQALGGRGADQEIQALMRHQSVAVRCAGAALIGRQRGKKKLTVLETQLHKAGSAEERACLAAALAKAGMTSALSQVVPMLLDPDSRALAEQVLRANGAKGLAVLSKALKKAPSDALIAASVAVARRLGQRGLLWTAARVRDKAPRIRRAALEALLARIAEAPARKLLMVAANAADPVTRARVIDALVETRDVSLIPMARKWLTDERSEVRAAAARVFAEIPSKKDGNRLLDAYQDERLRTSPANLPVRVALLRAMGAVGVADWVPVFVDAIGQPGEAQAATDALVAVGKPAVRTLLLVVKVGDMLRIPFALEALARIGDGVGAAAQDLFRHPKELVRELGRDLLAASGDPEAVSALVGLFRSETLDDPVPVIQAIATFDTPDSIAALADAVTHPSEAVRAAAVIGLGEAHRRSEDVTKPLTEVVETDKDPAVRAQALLALFRVGAPGVAALASRLVTFEPREVRMACYEVLSWAGDARAVAPLAGALRDAEGDEAKALDQALFRLTRRTDLKSARNFVAWSQQQVARITPRVARRKGGLRSGQVTLTWEEMGRGSPVIALDGAYSGRIWGPALESLAGSHRIILPNLRGRGGSPLGVGITLQSEVNDLERLRRHLKLPQISLVAHGASGLVAAAYARAYPKRVYRLVLVNTPAIGLRYGVASSAARMLKTPDARVLAALDARHAWFAPSAWLNYRQRALAPGFFANPARFAVLSLFASDSVVRQQLAKAVAGRRLGRLLDKVDVPTRLVLTDRAPLTSAQRTALRKLARSAPQIRLRELKGLGYFPQLENPKGFAATLAGLIGGA